MVTIWTWCMQVGPVTFETNFRPHLIWSLKQVCFSYTVSIWSSFVDEYHVACNIVSWGLSNADYHWIIAIPCLVILFSDSELVYFVQIVNVNCVFCLERNAYISYTRIWFKLVKTVCVDSGCLHKTCMTSSLVWFVCKQFYMTIFFHLVFF